jgi:pimeloyl-ACP methyl ester carboxylesterase
MSNAPVRIPSWLDEDGYTVADAVLTPKSDTREKIIECRIGPVVPVIFLPGIMGTNLKFEEDDIAVWTPPNVGTVTEILCALFSILGWWTRGPAARQTRLNPLTTRVDDSGTIRYAGSGLPSEAAARVRGWGEVHADSYHNFLSYLEAQLNNAMAYGEIMGDWAGPAEGTKQKNKGSPDKPILMTSPGEFGASESGPALTRDAIKHFAKNQYPVYAVGYNWLLSNADSAKYVHQRIKNICAQYGDDTKVIIVTHSMGGIVARALVALEPDAEDLIYGVVHGAQPATGAPLAAKRFRTGAEGFLGRALFGGSDAEWTAVAASSPAALELMPMPDYRNGRPWWRIENEVGRAVLALPKRDALTEIYTSSAWYGLIPNENLIDPAEILRKAAEKAGSDQDLKKIFFELAEEASKFQISISGKYHCTTYVLYGEGQAIKKEVEPEELDKLMSFGTVTWRGCLPPETTETDLREATLLHDNHRGVLKINIDGKMVVLTIQGPDERGDGTVPVSSALAQSGKRGVQQTFEQRGFDHQNFYDHPRARWATLYAIGNIAKDILQHGDLVSK